MKIKYTKYKFPETGKFYFATGKDYTDIYSNHIRKHFQLEPHTKLALELLKEGDKFIDIGANIGTFAIPLLKKGCSCLAIEAIPDNVFILQKP